MFRRTAFTFLLSVATVALFGCEAPDDGQTSTYGESPDAERASVDFASYLASGPQGYERVRVWIETAAEQVAEEDYSYRPTEEVRSFGELIAHLANGRYAFCGAAMGAEPPEGPAEDASKEELVEAIQDAGEYCAMAYSQATDASLGTTVEIFGSEARQIDALLGNHNHDNQHYGNIVTYMRELGMVPPSSQG